MKKILILLLVGLFFTPLSMSAQNASTHNHLHCGTSIEDQQVLFNSMVELRKRYPNVTTSRAVSYIPVWFHLVAMSDGTGRTTEANVAEMLCEWNKIYEANGLEMQFYIKGFSKIDLTALYNAPQSFSGTNRMLTTKKTDAMNVYLTNNAGDGTNPNEVVLAYYSNRSTTADQEYSNDWIVCINSQVNAASAGTIAHEAGHMFTLPHTFFGWEANGAFMPTAAAPCAPATLNYNGRVIQVEKVARTGASKNCDIAADGFCDTPEDYLFGFGWSGCNYTGIAKDPECVAVNPDETNIMGYFLSCLKNFSTEQKAAIRTNFLNHPKRAYLRNAATPPLAASTPTLVSPSLGATTTYFNNIQLDWNDVPNAFGYLVDVSRFASFGSIVKNFYVTSSDLNINALNAGTVLGTAGNVNIYWRVRPVVPYRNCDVATSNFRTSTLNSVKEITGITHFTVSPNPLSKLEALTLQMTSETAFDANVKWVNMTGQVVKTERRNFAAGYSTQAISVADLTNGTYILTVESEKGVLNKRVVIQ
jgi:Secretion system C-terminal sorting domain